MPKLRVLILVSLLIVAVASACTLPTGTEGTDISVEDAVAIAATVNAMSVAAAVEATLQAMAPDATETPTPQAYWTSSNT